jgi:hypothetical protein
MCRSIVEAFFLVWLLGATGASGTDAVDLLGKYKETQDKVQSVIIKCESTYENTTWYEPEVRKGVDSSEAAFDGRRIRVRFPSLGTERAFEQEEFSYRSALWDEDSFISYMRVGDDVGDVYMRNESPWRDRDYPILSHDNFLWGYLADDGKRVDAVLMKAETMSVRPEQEDVGGSPCYVIEARTPAGRYILWIDPHHGYNVAKAEVRRSEGDLHIGRPLPKGRELSFSLRNVRFERVDGIWVPMEGDSEFNKTWGKSYYDRRKTHMKRTEVILKPDHEELGSFALDDIRNGARVRVDGTWGIRYSWEKGELIPRIEGDTIAVIDEVTERFRTEGQELDSGANEPTTGTGQEEEAGEEGASEESDANDSGGFCRPPGQTFLSREQEQAAVSVSVLPVVIPTGVLMPVAAGIAWLILRRRKEVSDEIR